MTTLVIFKSAFVNALKSSISMNLEKYLEDDIWVAGLSTKKSREMKTALELLEPVTLEYPEDGNLKDIENAIRIHKALRHLTPLQARDPRLWTWLAHVEFWPYMRLRWPVEKHISNRNRASRYVETRYFVAQNQSRALLRNGMARLWWTAQLSYDAEREQPYELTRVLLSTLDITQQIVERNMGRAPNIIRGFLEFLLRHKDVLLMGGDNNRARIRKLAKHLNMCGGITVLDLLTQRDLNDLLDKELALILESEERAFRSRGVCTA